MTTTIDQKGSAPLPAEVLRESNVQPGDEMEVFAEDGGIVLRKVISAPPEGLLEILRSLKGLPLPERNRSSVRDVQL
jgi:AbrB family looped-hinge helix DNA binding protein